MRCPCPDLRLRGTARALPRVEHAVANTDGGKAGTGRTPTTRARKALLARCSALRERRSEAIARGVR